MLESVQSQVKLELNKNFMDIKIFVLEMMYNCSVIVLYKYLDFNIKFSRFLDITILI